MDVRNGVIAMLSVYLWGILMFLGIVCSSMLMSKMWDARNLNDSQQRQAARTSAFKWGVASFAMWVVYEVLAHSQFF